MPDYEMNHSRTRGVTLHVDGYLVGVEEGYTSRSMAHGMEVAALHKHADAARSSVR